MPLEDFIGGQGWTTVSNKPEKVKLSLLGRALDDANLADPLWLFAKFFAELYGCFDYPVSLVLVDLGYPVLVETSVWLKLKEFCLRSRYLNHPFVNQILDLCTFSDAPRQGGKQTNSSVTMVQIIKRLFPRSAAFKE